MRSGRELSAQKRKSFWKGSKQRRRTLHVEPLEARHLLAADFVAAYGFEEAGLQVVDASPYGQHGTASGATLATTGRFGSARLFDGINDWITINDTARLDLTQGMTLEAWVRPTALTDWTTVVLKERSGGLAYGLYASDGASRPPAGYIRRTQDINSSGTSNLPVNQWSHLAVTYNNSRLRLYVNGNLVSDRAISGSIATSNSPLRIGGNSVWGEYFAGLIDEVRIYNRALSQTEIQEDMVTPIVAAPDTELPTVAITSPASGSEVEGAVTVAASASDNVAVAGVQFLLNGQPLGAEDTTAPYSTVWDTSSLANGTYVLTARARDAAGNVRTSADVGVTVDNFVDVTPPDVTISEPLEGAELSGTVTVRAIASDDVGVASVQFFLNDVQLGAIDTAAPFAVAWNTAISPDGQYALRAVARDAVGNATSSTVVMVTVNNQDEESPTVGVTSPANGATVAGTINVTATASDNVGVVGVQFLLDGQPLGAEDIAAPYSISWNTASIGFGEHVLVARARDAAGNTTESSPVSVLVDNRDVTPPTVTISSPANGALVSGTINVTATASDNGGVAGVQFLVDGQPLGVEDTSSPYSVSWITGNFANGSHTLTAIARDAAGNTATSASVTVTVSNASGTPLVIDGSQRFQTIDGFGVNANVNSWDGGALQPTIARLADDLGSSLWRVYIDDTDWETTNDNADPRVFNWSYYNALYETPRFEEAWSLIGELNDHGITDGVILNFMGTGPTWLKSGLAINPALEDEWVEMILSYAYYARFTRGLEFSRLSPFNESDWDGKEGILADGPQVARVLAKIAVRLDELGMSDIRLVGPDTASASAAANSYIPAMLANSTVMAKVDDFGFHNYAGDTGGVDTVIANSAYSDRGFWVTEQSFGTTLDFEPINQIMNYLDRGATATLVFKAYDGQDNHHPIGEDFSLGLLQLSGGSYTPRYSYDVIKHVHKFIRPGMVRIAALESHGSLRMYAFQHPTTGQLTILGRNTSGSNIQVTGSLANLPAVGNFQMYRTTPGSSFGQLTDATVSGNAFSFSAPGNSVFTLVTAGPPDTTAPTVSISSPTDGATVSGSVALSAAASDNVSVVGVQFQVDGVNVGSEDLTAPYSVNWNSAAAANGSHQIRAIARDAAGNVTVSAVVNAIVGNVIDTSPPTVSVTAPTANSTVSGAVVLQANAADDIGVLGVQFFVNGVAVGAEDTSAPYTASWNTASVANGGYTITAQARDAAGHVTLSPAVAVTVSNVAPSSLVAAYSFDEGTGTVLGDISGNSLNGAITGASWTTAGRYGSALVFDGSNDWVTVADHARLDLTTSMTIEAWVRPTSLVDWTTIVLKERSGGMSYALYGSDNSNRPPAGYVNNGVDRAAIGTSALALNQWTHLATTFDGSQLRLYVNGTLVRTQAVTGAIAASSSPMRIGGNSVWGEFFAGAIDEVRIHNRALSAAEIQQDLNTPLGQATAEGEGDGVAALMALEGREAAVSPTSSVVPAPGERAGSTTPAQALRNRLVALSRRRNATISPLAVSQTRVARSAVGRLDPATVDSILQLEAGQRD